MGCWNETCMLSHLQIMHGDAVKLIILVNNNRDVNKSTRVYYNESYAPLILPIDATYNDYGGVENENDGDEFFKELNIYIMFAYALSTGRYGYITRCGAGGQDRDCSIQTTIAMFVLQFRKRKDEDDCRIYCDEEEIFWYKN